MNRGPGVMNPTTAAAAVPGRPVPAVDEQEVVCAPGEEQDVPVKVQPELHSLWNPKVAMRLGRPSMDKNKNEYGGWDENGDDEDDGVMMQRTMRTTIQSTMTATDRSFGRGGGGGYDDDDDDTASTANNTLNRQEKWECKCGTCR